MAGIFEGCVVVVVVVVNGELNVLHFAAVEGVTSAQWNPSS